MTSPRRQIGPDDLHIDCEAVVNTAAQALRTSVTEDLRRRGGVLGLSGGIDSSVCLALCIRAFGTERVLGLFTPERESSSDTLELSRMVAGHFGVETELVDITMILDAAGCYAKRDAAIRAVIPDFTADWKCKIVLPSVVDDDRFRIFSVIGVSPDGREVRKRLSAGAYLGIVAATNFKQRVRKMVEYHHADRLQYAVIGTPNRLEYDQGFFVKGGDGLADCKPIAHLYKSQVYQLAEYLGVPDEIRRRPPTTDTYSLAQGQDEFYFSLPYDKMDLCLFARNAGAPPEAVSDAIGLTPEQTARVFRDIDSKRRATRYLHLPPQLVEPVIEIGHP